MITRVVLAGASAFVHAGLALPALLLAGLIAGYAVTRAVAVPGLDGTPEPLDAPGVVTKCVELAGLVAAVRLTAVRERPRLVPGG